MICYAARMSSNAYVFRGIRGLTRLLNVFLTLGAVMALLCLVMTVSMPGLFIRGNGSEAELLASATRQQFLDLLFGGLAVATAITFGNWIVRANRNARALCAHGLRVSPGWAVGFFFIPLVNLWRPYQAMKDLWRASESPNDWGSVPVGAVVRNWWTLWILHGGIGYLAMRIEIEAQLRPAKSDDLQLAPLLSMFQYALYVALCVVSISLVSRIAKAQHSWVEDGA